MGTLTIRNLPDDLVGRIKAAAKRNGHSMEQEVREALAARYSSRDAIVERMRERAERMPPIAAGEIDRWIEVGREGESA